MRLQQIRVIWLAGLVCTMLVNSTPMVGQDKWDGFEPQDFSQKIDSAMEGINQRLKDGPFRPDWDSLKQYEIPEWYKDAKLGIFIHWGVYCVPEIGNEWYPRNMYIDRTDWRGNMFEHHQKTYGDQKDVGYKDFIEKLTAEKFNPESWVSLFKESGAKYVVPVAEHHDGFPMYDCGFTQWSSVKMGPKRDIVGELGEEVRKQGLKFGVSSHRAFNWLYFVRSKDFDNSDPRFSGLYGRPIPQLFEANAWDYKNNWHEQDEEFKNEWLVRTCELVDRYQPDLVWFDFGIGSRKVKKAEENPFAEHLQKFAAYYYNDAANKKRPTPIINYKWVAFPEETAVLDLERSKLDSTRELFWQTDTSVANNSWGYTAKQNYKPVNRIVDDFIDIISKNGCLLLNVGPKADGTIPQAEQEMLRQIGKWLKVNGEAVYGSRPFAIFGEGPTGTATGHLSENKNKPYGEKDFRFTTKGSDLFAFILKTPKNRKVNINSLGLGKSDWSRKFQSVSLIGSSDKLEWKQTEDGLEVTLPAEDPCDYALVLKIN